MEIDLERVLCRVEELAPTGCREFRLGGGEWPARGFAVKAGTEVRAYLNRCAHLALPLNMLPDRFLTHDGSLILCTAHGALFEKGSGYCVAGPCFGASLERIAVQVVAGFVLLDESVEVAALVARFD
ncbi:MAG: Rieske 2Fe-2S domain-containing protein [Gammaproteobacteria bacterium]|nr:Rieske 2Fe-2S domain-containing protein [Gammaproteobacteria bacterium]MDE2250809.1 Rieske 2Fe-2S domain-containing protein [Gammaproteobacteria bacterium]